MSLALRRYQEKLQEPRGRLITQHSVCPCFVFTDALYEPPEVPKPPKAGVGGILFNENAELVSWVFWQLPSSTLVDFIDVGAKALIFELEFLAVPLAVECWRNHVCERPVVFFVDNKSVRDSLLSARTKSEQCQIVLEAILRLEESMSLMAWCARVPTCADPGDAPSRGEL